MDISNPTAPVLAATYNTAGYAWGVAVAGSYAYVANRYNGLVIVDISTPTAPVLAATYGTAGNARGVAVAGSYAYIADASNGLVVVDISTPTAPALAANDTAGSAVGVAVAGSYAYVADWSNGLVVVDISTPTAPAVAGTYDTPGSAYGVAVAGSYAYVADGSNGLVVVDISNPTTPALAATYNTAGSAIGVAVSGSYAYVADWSNGLVIIDISNPTTPALAATYNTAGSARGIAVSESYAYVANDANGLVIVDISTPTAPALAGTHNTAGSAYDVAVAGSYAYVADRYNGLVIVDISTPTAPALSGTYDTAGEPFDVAVSGSYAYVVDNDNGLVILRTDVSSTTGSVHNINKGTNYTTIQAAIDDASPGDEIHVDAGTYIENVDVNKQLTLIGKGMDEVTVVAADTSDHVFEVTADYVNISGFMVTGTTGFYKAGFYLDNSFDSIISHNNASNNNCGIYFSNSSNTTLQNNIVLNNEFGIELWQSNNVILQNNRASNNNYGINLWNLDNNTLLSNTASDNRFGIGFSHSSNNTLQNNIISGNTYNFRIFGDSLADYTQQIDKTNMVDGKPIYYWMDQQDKQIPEDAGFIGVVNSTNILVKDLNLVNSGQGILFAYTKNSRIENVDVSNSWNCIDMHSSDNNTLHSNTASNNQFNIVLWYSNNNTLASNNASNNRFGFQLRDSNNNMLVSNNALNNWYGIYLNSSNDNTLYHNNLIDNIGNNAYDDSHNNAWDNGYPSGGNYLSDYTGVDLKKGLNQDQPGSDGIGDTPHPIPGGSSVDRYPLMAPYSTPPSDYEGKLLRQIGDFKIYLIEDDKKRHFTSPEALEWDGYSFDDIIEVSEDVINSFELGSDITITQAIIDKYNALGGAATFGPPAGTGEQPGYPDSAGVICNYVNFQNGAIEYFTNGDQAGNAYAILNPFFDKWASIGYGKSVLGYPISDMSDTQTSSLGTPFKYQNFMNGTERGALEYNLSSGEVFEIHGAIYATWSAMGYADSILGLVASDERDAVPSFKGTTGRVSDFEKGHLHWHSSGEHAGTTYMTYGDLDELYVSMGGTDSWLGFPVMHQEDRGEYGYCEFEGGYIEWDGSEYKAKAAIEIIKPSVVFEGTFDQFNYGTYPMIMEIISVDGLEFNGILHWPTLGDSKTKFRGNIDSVTNKIWFTEYEQIQGSSNIVLKGDYYADLEGQTLSGYWNWPNGVKGGTFSITMSGTEAPTITVTSPNGGEEWQAGTTQTIQWSYTGNLGPGVEIEIFNSSGPVQTFTYVSIGSDGSGSYQWLIPENLASGTDYQVKITIIGSAYSDTSGYYTISAPASGFTVGQGAPTTAIEQLFKDAYYDRNGGVGVLGNPTTEVHSAWGYWVQDFPGASGYDGGIIMYNPNVNEAYYIHGDIWDRYYTLGGPVATTDKEFQLGLPTSDVLPYVHIDPPLKSQISQYRYQNFSSGTERAALVHNLNSGNVVEIHGAIYNKWVDVGLADGVLGLVTGDEKEAGKSPYGTTGRYSEFENGHIHWVSDLGDDNAGKIYRGNASATYGDLDWFYTNDDGTNGDLGFPVMDKYETTTYGHGECVFEGGKIIWDDYRGLHEIIYHGYLPDLTITDISFSKENPAEGEPITIYATVKNVGYTDAIGEIAVKFSQQSYYEDFEGDEFGNKYYIGVMVRENLGAGESSIVSMTWNVAPVFSVNPKGFINVEVDSSKKIEETNENNNVEWGKVTISSRSNFKPEIDGYHFKNFPLTDAEIDKMIAEIGIWYDDDFYAALLPKENLDVLLKELFSKSANCYGMSASSTLYYHQLVPKPEDKDTFDLSKTDEVKQKIYDYQVMQAPYILDEVLRILFQDVVPIWHHDVKIEYNIIKYHIENDKPIISNINYFYKDEYTLLNRPDARHALTPFNTYDVSENIKNVLVYDSNHPGMATVVQFDFDNNKITYNDFDEEYMLFGRYSSTKYPLMTMDDAKNTFFDILKEFKKAFIKQLHDSKSKYLIFKCPIDITIIDQYGHIIDNKGKNEIPGAKVNIVGDLKMFLLPADLDYTIKIDAYDSGDFTFTQINPLTSEYASLISFVEVPITENTEAISEVSSANPEYKIKIDYDGDGIIDETIKPEIIDVIGANFYDITFLPPIITKDQYNLKDGSTLPIKFTARNNTTDEFIYDDTVNVSITNSTGHLITYFTHGKGTDSVRINSEEEQYIVNFHSKNYDLNVGETYSITVTIGEQDSLRGYEITYFTLVDKGKGKKK